MKSSIRLFPVAILLFTPAVLGCDMAPEAGDDVAAIANGFHTGPTGPVSHAIGLGDQGCSFTFIEQRTAVTTKGCATRSSQVTVGAITAKIRTHHTLIDDNRQPHANLEIVSFRSPVKLAANPNQRRFDRRVVAAGDVLSCYGFDSRGLRWGIFEVVDPRKEDKGNLALAGQLNLLNGAPFEVTRDDIGGFCVYDGSADPAAILIGESIGGIATAARVDTLGRGAEAAASLSEVVKSGAVRLLDDSETMAVTARMTAPEATFEASNLTADQGFYRHEVQNGGGGPYVQLVDALSGECLTMRGGQIDLAPCGSAGDTFLEHVEHLDGWDRYSYLDPTGRDAIDASSTTLTSTPWSGAAEQRFRMWLAPY